MLRGCGFSSLSPGKWARQPISPPLEATSLTQQHRMFWFAFYLAPSLGGQAAQPNSLFHIYPQGTTGRPGTKNPLSRLAYPIPLC